MNIEIGTPCAYSIGSDTYPCTIIGIERKGKVLIVQYDNFEGDKEAGHEYFGIQKWKFSRNPNGRTEKFGWKPKRNRYTPMGESSGCLHIGKWMANHDPSF